MTEIKTMGKITIDSRFRPELLVRDEEIRENLTRPYLRRDPEDGSKWVIDVTNGHYAARFPATKGDGNLREGWLDPRLWQIERKKMKMASHVLTAEISTDLGAFGAFPDFRSIFPRGAPKEQASAALNPAYLALIAKSFGLEKGSGLKLAFFGALDPILITPVNRTFPKGLWALLMPMRA